MAWLLRIEFKGALYHVMARGNARADIFLDDEDHQGIRPGPAALLHGLIADLRALHDWVDDPGSDGYASHGSDQRALAWAGFERCEYGMEYDLLEE